MSEEPLTSEDDAEESGWRARPRADAEPYAGHQSGKRRRSSRMRGLPGRAPRWEPVWEGNGEAQASVVAGGLDSSGIRSQVTFSRLAAQPFAHESWVVMVPLRQADAARDLLHQRGEGHRVVTGDDDVSAEQVATLKFVAIALVAALIIGLFLAIKAA